MKKNKKISKEEALEREYIKKKRNLEYKQKKKKIKMEAKKKIEYKFLILFFVLFFIYIISTIFQIMTNERVDSTIVTLGVVDLSKSERGLIVREEEVYKMPIKGSVIYNITEHDKARQSDVVVTAINDKNLAFENENLQTRMTMKYFENEYEKNKEIIENINNKIKKYIDNSQVNDYKEIGLLSDYISSTLKERESILMLGKKSSYDNKDGIVKVEIKAKESGIVSYLIDGEEKNISPNKISEITEKDVNKKYQVVDVNTTQVLEKDISIFKLVKSNVWYVVSYIDNDRLENIEEGTYHRTQVYNKNKVEEIYFFIEKIERGEKKTKVVLRSTKYIQDYLNSRTLEFKLFDKIYEGMKIPTTSIVKKNKLAIKKSFIVEEEGEYFITIGTTAEDKKKVKIDIYLKGIDYYYANMDNSTIKVGDLIFDYDNNIYQISIKEIEGVYLLNYTFPVFKTIIKNNNIPKELNIAILSVKENKNIKNLDKIATFGEDIKNRRDGG